MSNLFLANIKKSTYFGLDRLFTRAEIQEVEAERDRLKADIRVAEAELIAKKERQTL